MPTPPKPKKRRPTLPTVLSAGDRTSRVIRYQRRDARMQADWACAAEKLADLQQKLDPALAKVYERVQAEPQSIGKRYKMRVRDVSQNGAFLEGEPLPLLSRVALVFDVPGFRAVEAVGWVLWRRKDSCRIGQHELGAGCGVLFEWITLEARNEIARQVAERSLD